MLTKKDIEKISRKTNKETKKRTKFESKVEIYMTNLKPMTYAILWPRWPFKSVKRWDLIYYKANFHDFHLEKTFNSYKEFKKFKKENLRKITEFEMYKLKESNKFNNHFKITDVEDTKLSANEIYEMDYLLKNFFKKRNNNYE